MRGTNLVNALTLSAVTFVGVVGCDGSSSSSDEMVTLELRVVSYAPGMENVPVSGAEACVLGTQDCVTTGVDGVAMLQIPANSESAVTLTADGFNPTLSTQVAEGEDLTLRETSMLSEAVAGTLALLLGIEYPLQGTGVIALTAVTDPNAADSGVPGVTYTLVDGQGQSYYLDENGIPLTALSATSAPSGAGGFVELSPGTYEIELGGTASNCDLLAAWAGSSPEQVKVPVEAGFFTDAYILCDPVAP